MTHAKPQESNAISLEPDDESQKTGKLMSGPYVQTLAVQLAFGVAYSAFLLLPKFLAIELRASATEIGNVMGTALVLATLASPLIGLSAPYIKRTHLLVLALCLEAVGGFGFAFVTELGPEVYFFRALQGLAWVIVFNCTATIAADIVPQHRLSQAIGFLGISMLVTNALAPAIAEPVADRFGWTFVFLVPSVVVLCALSLVRGLKEPKITDHAATTSSDQQVASTTMLAIYLASFAMGCGIGVMMTFTQPFALSLGAERVGDLFFGYVASALFVRLGLSWVADKFGARRVATLALLTYGLTVVAAAKLTPDTLLPLGAGIGFSHGFLYPALVALGMGRVSGAKRSLFMGYLAGSFNAGYAACVLSLGPVADANGYPIVFLVTGLFIGLSALPLGLSGRPSIPALKRAAS